MISRKHFIQHATTLTAGTLLATTSDLFSSNTFQTNAVSFDLHTHPGLFFAKGMKDYPGDDGVTKTVKEMNAGNLSGAFFSLVADAIIIERTPTGIRPVRPYAAGEGLKEYQHQITSLKEILMKLPARLATKAADLDESDRTKKVAAFISCEGGDFLEGKTDLLDQMYEDGVRSLQIVHYAPNPLGDLQTGASQHNGLSTSGKELVKKLNKLGMVIDVAHASFKTVQDTASITNAPIILSHSILKMEEDRPLSKRAISVEHAKVVASTGGVIGAWPSGFNKNFDEFVDNMLRLVDAIGIDHVGLGTDMDGNFKPVLSSYLQLPQLIEALKMKGLSSNDVDKLMGGNAKRVLASALKG